MITKKRGSKELQNKSKHKNNLCFSELLLSKSFLMFPQQSATLTLWCPQHCADWPVLGAAWDSNLLPYPMVLASNVQSQLTILFRELSWMSFSFIQSLPTDCVDLICSHTAGGKCSLASSQPHCPGLNCGFYLHFCIWVGPLGFALCCPGDWGRGSLREGQVRQ